MFSLSPQKISTWLACGGAALAGATVGLFSLFPGARLIGLGLVVLAGGLFWASRRVATPSARGERWLRTPLDIPVTLLLLQIGLSFWASAMPDKSWVAIGQLVAGLVAFYGIVSWSRDRARLWWAVIVLIALGLGLALIAPFAVDWFRERKTFLPSALYRLFPLILSDPVHPNVMAGALVTLIPLPLALFLSLPAVSRRQQFLRGALLVICSLQILILLLTKSRGGYIALGAGLWLTLWLSGRRRWAIGLALVCVLVLVWLAIQPAVETQAGSGTSQAALDASTWAFRQQVWYTALQVIGDFPFTGVGLGTFNDVAALLYGFYAPATPGTHNLYLQVAVDLGLLGLVSFLAMLLIVIWVAVKAYRSHDSVAEGTMRAVASGGLAGMVATMAHGLVDSHTWGSKGAFIPWLVMGLLVALYSLALPRSPGVTDVEE
jgi:putative inorganic carbon (HCO3(-)) transporter